MTLFTFGVFRLQGHDAVEADQQLLDHLLSILFDQYANDGVTDVILNRYRLDTLLPYQL